MGRPADQGSGSEQGFLEAYTLRRPFARASDIQVGRPALLYGRDPDHEAVLIRTWPHGGGDTRRELEAFWQHEIRQLRRLESQVQAADLFAPISAAGVDSEGFHLVSRIDTHRLLATS